MNARRSQPGAALGVRIRQCIRDNDLSPGHGHGSGHLDLASDGALGRVTFLGRLHFLPLYRYKYRIQKWALYALVTVEWHSLYEHNGKPP